MATPNTYDVGAKPTLTGTFYNASNALTDPTTVTCTVRDPAGVVTTPAVTHVSTGVYTATLDLTSATPGLWWYRFQGVGTLQAAEEATFFVEASNV